MKQSGCHYYDLYGINPQKNPGTYVFKAGLAGKTGKDVYYLGRFDCYPGATNAALAHTADFVFPLVRKIRSLFRSKNRYRPREP
jgi:lipid II:glycine glycyltransferase (peptidoglycan interpeptide bridge formation enzyme)